MRIGLSTTFSKMDEKDLSSWDEAIREAKKRIIEMKQSLRIFEEMRDNGMRFPSKKSRRSKKTQEQSKSNET